MVNTPTKDLQKEPRLRDKLTTSDTVTLAVVALVSATLAMNPTKSETVITGADLATVPGLSEIEKEVGSKVSELHLINGITGDKERTVYFENGTEGTLDMGGSIIDKFNGKPSYIKVTLDNQVQIPGTTNTFTVDL